LAVVRLMTKSIGYQLLYALYNDYDPDVAAEAFWRLLAVPVGGPILFLVIAWVVAGFSKSASNPVGPKPSTGYAIDEQEPTGEKFEVEASRNAASTSEPTEGDSRWVHQLDVTVDSGFIVSVVGSVIGIALFIANPSGDTAVFLLIPLMLGPLTIFAMLRNKRESSK